MKQEIVISAKTVEQAIAEGARALNAPEEEVNYEILQEPKKGFLGIGEQLAKVKVSYTPSRGNAAQQFLETLLQEMEVHVTVRCREEEDRVQLQMEGDDAGILIGYHGETLDALQYLTNLAVSRQFSRESGEDSEYRHISLDADGYREKREEVLRSLARRTAAKVRRYHRSVTLEPMNPSDRRIIHSEVQNVAGVATESVGSEGHRCVVVFPEGQTPNPEPRRGGERQSRQRDRGGRRSSGRRSSGSSDSPQGDA